MIKSILSAAALSFALVSAAWALPSAPKTELPALSHTDVVQVGKKGHYKGHGHYKHYKYHGPKHYRGRYYHGGRYWGRRYYYRPYNWRAWGCVAVGPIWYCP